MSEALILLFVLGFWIAIITLVAIVMRLRHGRSDAGRSEIEEVGAGPARKEASPENTPGGGAI